MKLLHTADLHLGMKFAGYPTVREELTEARFRCLERLVETANRENCDLFALAGDLFDRITVAHRDIIRTAGILDRFEGKLVLVLPGNHDYRAPGQEEPWGAFVREGGDRLLLLDEKKKYDLKHFDLDMVVYPAPCHAKHSRENALGWIEDAAADSASLRLGLAHGSLEGLSPDFDGRFYPMTVKELEETGLDCWLLGHTHIPYPAKPGPRDRIFYSSTPEPDGFDCRHPGHAWLIEIGEDKTIRPTLLTTGQYRFLHDRRVLGKEQDLARLLEDYAGPGAEKKLVKLKLEGRLPSALFSRIGEVREKLAENLFYLSWDTGELSEEITREMIEKQFTEGSFPFRLLSRLAEDGTDPEALQIAYHLIEEAKK